MTTYEATGKTLDEAIRAGLSAMGVERDAVSVEILEKKKSGFFGFGGSPARVRLTLIDQEPLFTPSVPKQQPKQQPRQQQPKQQPKAAPRQEAKPAPVKRAPQQTQTPRKASRPTFPATPKQEQDALNFVTGLMERMGTNATAKARTDGDGVIQITLEGENLGSLIGHRGDTLDAIQHLTTHVINHDPEKMCRVHVDAANYRAKRQEALERLAKRMAENTLKYRNNMVLEPMNAYERHIIHVALQDVQGITTYSQGVEPQRRVVIACQGSAQNRSPRSESAGGRPRGERGERRGQQHGGRGGSHQRPPRSDGDSRRSGGNPPRQQVKDNTPAQTGSPAPRGLPVKEFGVKRTKDQ